MSGTNDLSDEVWRRQNIVEIVHMAALQLNSKSETFTLRELVKVARRFYRGRLTDSLVAAALAEACVEADMASDSLRLAA